jgi:heme oxygenase
MEPRDEVAELRAATREAHEVLKDLRRTVKEAMQFRAAMEHAAQVSVDEQVKAVVEKGLDDYGRALKLAIDDATRLVYKRFDRLADILLGEDKATKRRGKPSLPELSRELRRQ